MCLPNIFSIPTEIFKAVLSVASEAVTGAVSEAVSFSGAMTAKGIAQTVQKVVGAVDFVFEQFAQDKLSKEGDELNKLQAHLTVLEEELAEYEELKKQHAARFGIGTLQEGLDYASTYDTIEELNKFMYKNHPDSKKDEILALTA